jgi:hypothetical protein
MNVFYLDPNPRTCAKYHCDKHVNKMILETAQLLSTAHRMTDSPYADQCYKIAHKNHPSAIWARSSVDHYSWLFELFRELTNEFNRRKGTVHASWTKLKSVLSHTPDLPLAGFTPPPQCMDDEYKQDDTVEAYRAYYRGGKADIARWDWDNNTPDWWHEETSKESIQGQQAQV